MTLFLLSRKRNISDQFLGLVNLFGFVITKMAQRRLENCSTIELIVFVAIGLKILWTKCTPKLSTFFLLLLI